MDDMFRLLIPATVFLFLFFFRSFSPLYSQLTPEKQRRIEWEVQQPKSRRALDMSSELVFVAALSKLTTRFSSCFSLFSFFVQIVAH
jgi:hypothetical protein